MERTFLCTKCGFNFESKERKEQCPYCGERRGIQEADSAERLVEDL